MSENQPHPLRVPGPWGRRQGPQRAPVQDDTRSNGGSIGTVGAPRMYLSQPEITGKLSRAKDSSQILEGGGGGKAIPVKGNRQSKSFVQKVQKVRSSFGGTLRHLEVIPSCVRSHGEDYLHLFDRLRTLRPIHGQGFSQITRKPDRHRNPDL